MTSYHVRIVACYVCAAGCLWCSERGEWGQFAVLASIWILIFARSIERREDAGHPQIKTAHVDDVMARSPHSN
jgi:hypothetical protein